MKRELFMSSHQVITFNVHSLDYMFMSLFGFLHCARIAFVSYIFFDFINMIYDMRGVCILHTAWTAEAD